ncbi:hypothetical protein ACS0TY_036679 [Phlomoides rotata]
MFLDFAVVVDGEDVAKFTDAVKNLSLSKIIVEVEKQGSSFSELFAVPEQDDWVYADWKSASRVAFVFELYKAGGLFGELASSIQVTVFTVREKCFTRHERTEGNENKKIHTTSQVPTIMLGNKIRTETAKETQDGWSGSGDWREIEISELLTTRYSLILQFDQQLHV